MMIAIIIITNITRFFKQQYKCYKRCFNLINLRNYSNLFLQNILIKSSIIYLLIKIYLKIIISIIIYFHT